MGFRQPLTDLDDLSGVDVDLIGSFATALDDPRVLVHQTVTDGGLSTTGAVELGHPFGDPAVLRLDSDTDAWRLFVGGGTFGSTAAPYLVASVIPPESPGPIPRQIAVRNVDYLAVEGDSRAARFIADGDNYNYVSASPEAGWSSTISRYTVRQGEVTYTFRLTRASWAANQRVFVFPFTLRPAENMTFWSGGNELALRANDGLLYLPFAGSVGIQGTITWPVG